MSARKTRAQLIADSHIDPREFARAGRGSADATRADPELDRAVWSRQRFWVVSIAEIARELGKSYREVYAAHIRGCRHWGNPRTAFRLEVVAAARKHGVAPAARTYEVPDRTIRTWMKRAAEEGKACSTETP